MENIFKNLVAGKNVITAGVNVEITNETLIRITVALLLLAFIIVLMVKFI